MRLLHTLACALLASTGVGAQQSAPPLTVDDVVRLAVARSPRLSAAMHYLRASRSGVRSALALASPEVRFTPGITSPGGSDEELLIAQPLELNGTRAARIGLARADQRKAQAVVLGELRELVYRAKAAYAELAGARELQLLSADLLQIAVEVDRRMRKLVEEGRRAGIELTQTGIEVARARQQVILAESAVAVAEAALRTLLGRSTEAPIGALAPLSFSPQPLEPLALVNSALAVRSEIEVEEAVAEAFRQEARRARADGLPDLVPQFRATSVARGLREAGLGISVTLPLVDWGSRRARVRQAEESGRAQADRVTAARDQVRLEVTQAVARLRAAETVLQQQQQGILDHARRLLDGRRIGLAEGQADILSVLEAQRTYRTVQTEHTGALVAWAHARAELERAAGSVPASLLPDLRRLP